MSKTQLIVFWGVVVILVLVHYYPPITKSKFNGPIKSMLWGFILILVACGFIYHLAGNPLHELALIRRAQIATGYLVDTHEYEQEDDRGHVYVSEVGVYTYRLPDGREFKTSTRVPTGQSEEQVEVEYLPDNPAVSRVKGDGCDSITEFLWRKVCLGGIMLVVFCSFGVRMVRDGVRNLCHLCGKNIHEHHRKIQTLQIKDKEQ